MYMFRLISFKNLHGSVCSVACKGYDQTGSFWGRTRGMHMYSAGLLLGNNIEI